MKSSGWTGWMRLAVPAAVLAGAAVPAYGQGNELAARILGMFDIDGRGGADESPDSDGDGLPDSWEVGGLDPAGTDVPFPAPQAIVPGTPPDPIFARRPVRTSATSRDTDGDGLTDFIEVFGLKFIDDNNNGILDDASVRDGTGAIIFLANGNPQRATDGAGNPIGEWFDFNGDGMPSIGEFPATNVLVIGASENFDYDGFVFTDPTNPDTDGDGVSDGADNDPLVNPRSFGLDRAFFSSGGGDLVDDRDFDNDGLGNGMDLGNDVARLLDNPSDLSRVLEVFRPDLVENVDEVRVPEGLIEDLLSADWNGDGLFRLTDLLNPRFGLVDSPVLAAGTTNLFRVQNPDDPLDTIALGFSITAFPANFRRTDYFRFALRGEQGVNPPLSHQEALVPAGRDDNVFLPDPRIWTVLYSWRMPGFDVDGNGFIGFDGASFSGRVTVNGADLVSDVQRDAENAPSSEHEIPAGGINVGDGDLDGQVDVNCGTFGLGFFSLTVAGILGLSRRRRFVP